MPGWEERPLGVVCTIKPPKSEARAKLADTDAVSFAPMEDLGIGVKYLQPHRTRPLAEVNGSYTYFADGDVLLAKITPCFENGKLGVARGLMNGVGFGSSEYIVLRPAPTLDAEFLYYYLARPAFLEEGAGTMTGAVGHKPVPKELAESYPVPLPPLAEQRRIVAILDEAFEGIATAKANVEKSLQSTRELFTERLHAAFSQRDPGIADASLSEVCDITSKLVDPREVEFADLPHVGAGNIESRTGALIDVMTARQEQLISGKFLFDETTVLYSKIRPYLMKVARPDFAGLCSADIYPLTPRPGLMSRDYLYHLLLSPAFTEFAIKGSARAGMPKVNREHLFAYRLALPSCDQQQRVTANLDEIDAQTRRLESIYNAKLAALDELKRSLLHQAFSGGLS